MEKALEQYPSSGIKIVLFGPESSGKTTLARALSRHYQTPWVPEFMRSYLQKKWDENKHVCTKEDLLPIAKGQMIEENRFSKAGNALVITDTNLLELKVYSEYYFDGYCPPEIVSAAQENQYDFYFLTYIDTPWEEDDLRDRPYDRSTLFCMFEEELIKNKLPFKILKGTHEFRLQTAVEVIDRLLLERNANK